MIKIQEFAQSKEKIIEKTIKTALDEDVGFADITTNLIITDDKISSAKIIAENDGILAGLDVAQRTFITFDPKVEFIKLINDGQKIQKGKIIAQIKGKARTILACERVALNFIQHLSGIATNANNFSKKIKGLNVKLLDTRKTTPGLRFLEKQASMHGGFINHRMGLYDMYLIKDNHIKEAGLKNIVEKTKGLENVEIEIDSILQLKELLNLRPKISRIMLDNMEIKELKKAIEIIENYNKTFKSSIKTEYSGGVTLENIKKISSTGVNYISVGTALNLSSKALGFKIEIN